MMLAVSLKEFWKITKCSYTTDKYNFNDSYWLMD